METKVVLAAVAAVLVLAVPLVLTDSDGVGFTDGDFSYSIVDGEAVIGSYDGDSPSVVIPSETSYDGKTYPVTAVGDEAFRNGTLQSVTIPSSVCEVGYSAFVDSGLKEIVFPDTPVRFAWNPFGGTPLESVTVPGWMDNPGDVFTGCHHIREYRTSGETYASVAGVLFANEGTALAAYPEALGTSYDVPEGTEDILPGAFSGNMSLKSVSLPDGLTEIGDRAFRDCLSLTEAVLPDSLVRIGDGAFTETAVKIDTLPASLESVGNDAFRDCHRITDLTVPGNVESIGVQAFAYCSIQSLKLCEGLREIGDYAFIHNRFAFVQVPESVRTVGELAFTCGLTEFLGDPDASDSLYGNHYTGLNEGAIPDAVYTPGYVLEGGIWYAAEGTTAVVTGSEPFSDGTLEILPDIVISGKEYPVSSIADNAFRGSDVRYMHPSADRDNVPDSKMTGALLVPSCIRSFGEMSFEGSSLTEMTVPDTVRAIGDSAFSSCEYLVRADVGASQIGALSFAYCEDLSDLRLRGTVEAVGWGAFIDCGLTEITLSGFYLEGNAFDGCGIRTVILDDRVSSFDPSVFDENPVERIEVDPSNGSYCLKDGVLYSYDGRKLVMCPAAKEGTYSVPAGTEIIGDHAFRLSRMSDVSLPDGLRSIGDEAFLMSAAKVFTIPQSVDYIGMDAFVGCIIYAECDGSLIDFTLNADGNSQSVLDGTFLYHVEDGHAVITGLTTDSPRSVTVPSSVTVNGTALPVRISPGAFAGVHLDRISFAGMVFLEGTPLAGLSADVFVVGDWMSPKFLLDELYLSSIGSFECSGHRYASVDGNLTDGHGKLIKVPSRTSGEFSVPTSVDSISANAFNGCRITVLEIPASVQYAETYSFAGLKDVTVVIGNGAHIGEKAFYRTEGGVSICSEVPVACLDDYVYVQKLTYSSVDAPDGFRIPEDSFIPIGEEVVPAIPQLEGYEVIALVGSEPWEPDTLFMDSDGQDICFVFDYKGVMSPGISLIIMAVTGIGLVAVVIAFVLVRKPSRKNDL